MISPFSNNMFSMTYQAFNELYPDKTCHIQWTDGLMDIDEEGNTAKGVTVFSDDGVYVDISVEVPVINAVEVLAHELAHVAAGEAEQHGPGWETAFDAIFKRYCEIAQRIFGKA